MPKKANEVKGDGKGADLEPVARRLFAVLSMSPVEKDVVRVALAEVYQLGWDARDDKAAEDSL